MTFLPVQKSLMLIEFIMRENAVAGQEEKRSNHHEQTSFEGVSRNFRRGKEKIEPSHHQHHQARTINR